MNIGDLVVFVEEDRWFDPPSNFDSSPSIVLDISDLYDSVLVCHPPTGWEGWVLPEELKKIT